MASYSHQITWLQILGQEVVHSQTTCEDALGRAMNYLLQQNTGFYWVGIYYLQGNELHLGPYSGPVTEHTRIPVGLGVCGTAVSEDQDQIVQDISERQNYLACNLSTQAEAVILLRTPEGKVFGQLDIDGTQKGMFDSTLVAFLNEVARLLETMHLR